MATIHSGTLPEYMTPAPVVTQQPLYVIPPQQQQPQPQVVVVNAGESGGPIKQNTVDWDSGLCSCCEEMQSCFLGCFCFPVMAYKVAKRMDESCCVPLCLLGGLMAMRTKLRTQHGIVGSICDDWRKTCCCPLLALCQMDRELKCYGY